MYIESYWLLTVTMKIHDLLRLTNDINLLRFCILSMKFFVVSILKDVQNAAENVF